MLSKSQGGGVEMAEITIDLGPKEQIWNRVFDVECVPIGKEWNCLIGRDREVKVSRVFVEGRNIELSQDAGLIDIIRFPYREKYGVIVQLESNDAPMDCFMRREFDDLVLRCEIPKFKIGRRRNE